MNRHVGRERLSILAIRPNAFGLPGTQMHLPLRCLVDSASAGRRASPCEERLQMSETPSFSDSPRSRSMFGNGRNLSAGTSGFTKTCSHGRSSLPGSEERHPNFKGAGQGKPVLPQVAGMDVCRPAAASKLLPQTVGLNRQFVAGLAAGQRTHRPVGALRAAGQMLLMERSSRSGGRSAANGTHARRIQDHGNLPTLPVFGVGAFQEAS